MIGRNPAPLTVQIPPDADGRPSWIKVGVIAVVGFAVGVAWPRLAGIRPGPSAPAEVTQAAATGRAPDAPATSAAAAATAASDSTAAATPAAPSAAASDVAAVPLNNAPPAVLVTHGNVTYCKTQEGETLKGKDSCGALAGFDGIAQPRLKKLAYCPGAQGLSGKLGVIFQLDFTRNKINFNFGKATVGNKDSLDQCLRMSLLNVSLGPVPHDNPSYAMFYSVTFTPRDSVPGTPSAQAAANEPPPPESAAQTAQVAWEVAIVRDNPRTGTVIARLQRGTKVKVGAGQDGWFKIGYGADMTSEGWVYRGAIGK
jgi:hypothetical protein